MPPVKATLPQALIPALAAAAGMLHAAERFPFVIPGDDATPSFTDLSALNATPAGAGGFVRIEDGHFVTDAGWLRIWGVNVCFGANFPAQADAGKVAAHLAKLGVNGVPVKIEVPGRKLKVTALDGRGLPMEGVEVEPSANGSRIEVGPRHRSLWYALTAE